MISGDYVNASHTAGKRMESAIPKAKVPERFSRTFVLRERHQFYIVNLQCFAALIIMVIAHRHNVPLLITRIGFHDMSAHSRFLYAVADTADRCKGPACLLHIIFQPRHIVWCFSSGSAVDTFNFHCLHLKERKTPLRERGFRLCKRRNYAPFTVMSEPRAITLMVALPLSLKVTF